MPSNHLILSQPLLLLPSIFPIIRVFLNKSALRIRWPKYWSFSYSPSSEYSGLISFRIDWFGLLAVQGTLENLLQHHSLKASILWRSIFFTVQLSHLYMTTVENIALTRCTFVGKVMSLLSNTLCRFVIVFLPKNKHLLISWLQSLFAVILEPQKIKPVTVSIASPSICHKYTYVPSLLNLHPPRPHFTPSGCHRVQCILLFLPVKIELDHCTQIWMEKKRISFSSFQT